MEKEMTGADRRKKLIFLMRESEQPLSGTQLGQVTGVSRQVVVQDIALLRTEGYPIVSTAKGYLLNEPKCATRVLKVCHTNEQVEEELTTIVDLGGTVLNVMVNHRVYGRVEAALNIRNRRDVQGFLNDLRTGKSVPLLNVTSGYHFTRFRGKRRSARRDRACTAEKGLSGGSDALRAGDTCLNGTICRMTRRMACHAAPVCHREWLSCRKESFCSS